MLRTDNQFMLHCFKPLLEKDRRWLADRLINMQKTALLENVDTQTSLDAYTLTTINYQLWHATSGCIYADWLINMQKTILMENIEATVNYQLWHAISVCIYAINAINMYIRTQKQASSKILDTLQVFYACQTDSWDFFFMSKMRAFPDFHESKPGSSCQSRALIIMRTTWS